MTNPCKNNQCSHLCLIIPGGTSCACPDNSKPKTGISEMYCDAGEFNSFTNYLILLKMNNSNYLTSAASELPKPAPQICMCENGGICIGNSNGELKCLCATDFSGPSCELHAKQSRMPFFIRSNLIYPFVVAILLISAVLLFFVLRKKPL